MFTCRNFSLKNEYRNWIADVKDCWPEVNFILHMSVSWVVLSESVLHNKTLMCALLCYDIKYNLIVPKIPSHQSCQLLETDWMETSIQTWFPEQTRMHCILIGNGHPLNKPIVHTKSKENCVKTFLIKLITSSIANYRKKSDLVIVTRGRRRGEGRVTRRGGGTPQSRRIVGGGWGRQETDGSRYNGRKPNLKDKHWTKWWGGQRALPPDPPPQTHSYIHTLCLKNSCNNC